MPASREQTEQTRQRKVALAELTAKGLDTAIIAQRLGISIKTVQRMQREMGRDERAARIRQEAWREAEEARERRISVHQITNTCPNGRRTW